MHQNVKTLLWGVLLSGISYGIMLIFEYLILVKLSDWIFPLTNKYIVVNLTVIDLVLVRFFPIIVAIIHITFEKKNIKEYFKNVFWVFIVILVLMFLGLVIALLTWTHGEENPLLPEYIKYQPFDYYWTIFIACGLIGSILYRYFRRI